MIVSNIYNQYQKGQTPANNIVYDDEGRIDVIISSTPRNDTVVAKHTNDVEFKIIRISPKYESQHQKIQRHIQNPTKPLDTSRNFECCEYQLMRLNIPEFRKEETKVGYNTLHNNCHWNSKRATKLRTARGAERLQENWNRY